MNIISALLMTVATQTPVWLGEKKIDLEPCYDFEIEETVTLKGQAPKSRREVCFTAVELPWASVGIPPTHLLETGFTLTEEPAAVEFGGKKAQATKMTWTRDPRGFGNVSAARVTFWVLKEVETPTFKVRLGQDYAQFLVPRGCVKMEVIPHEKNAKGIDDFERERTFAATGEYGKATTYKLADRELKAHEFICKTGSGPAKGTYTYTLSEEMPGGLCATAVDGESKVTVRVVAIKPTPVPKDLVFFPQAGLAFAPPPGYATSAKLKGGEVARFENAKNDFISVATIPLGKGGLDAIEKKMWKAASNDAKNELHFVGYARYHHLAGHPSFDAVDRNTKVYYIVTHHAGRAYVVGASALGNLTPTEASDFLKGWRWIIPDKK